MATNYKDVLISVIIPVYNVEIYLSKCIESVIAQSHHKLEVLLIDDGSSDKCPQICDEYARADSRIRVVHKKNGGIADARNVGLELANGEYVAFVDSDDYIDGCFVESLLNNAKLNKADIAVCSYYKEYGDRLVQRAKSTDIMIYTNIEAMRDILCPDSVCEVMSCNKLYNKKLFTDHNIEFPVGRVHEDDATTYKLFYFSNRISFMNKPLYYYTQRQGSTMSNRFSAMKKDAIEAADAAYEWVEKYRLPLREEVTAYQLRNRLFLLNSMVGNNKIDNSTWVEIAAWILANKASLSKNRYVTRNQQLLILTTKIGIKPYAILRRIHKLARSLVANGRTT